MDRNTHVPPESRPMGSSTRQSRRTGRAVWALLASLARLLWTPSETVLCTIMRHKTDLTVTFHTSYEGTVKE